MDDVWREVNATARRISRRRDTLQRQEPPRSAEFDPSWVSTPVLNMRQHMDDTRDQNLAQVTFYSSSRPSKCYLIDLRIKKIEKISTRVMPEHAEHARRPSRIKLMIN